MNRQMQFNLRALKLQALPQITGFNKLKICNSYLKMIAEGRACLKLTLTVYKIILEKLYKSIWVALHIKGTKIGL